MTYEAVVVAVRVGVLVVVTGLGVTVVDGIEVCLNSARIFAFGDM